MISSTVQTIDSGTPLPTGTATKPESNSTNKQLATPSSESQTSNLAPADTSATEPEVFTPRKEEHQKATPLTDLTDEKENLKSSDNQTKPQGRRTSRRFRRSEQDPIIAPGFGTARDIRRLADQLSVGNEIQLTPEAVEEVMNARGTGLASSRSTRSGTSSEPVEQAPASSSSAWADFMEEEGVTGNAEASKSVTSTTSDRKRAPDTNDKDSKKKKVVSADVDDDETKDLLVQHHGFLLQTGTLDTLVVGRSKGAIKNPPAYNLLVPTKILPKVVIRSVHTSSSSCHSIAISNSGVVYGWGRNECHQLASNLLDDVALPTILELPKHSPVISAATGKSHTLFLYADGSVYATGFNKTGQCGVKANLDTIGSYRKCVFQQRGETVEAEIKQIACGEDFSMAVSTEGYLFSAGSSEFGQLGNGETGEHIVSAGKIGFANSTYFGRRSAFCHAADDGGGSNKVVKVVQLDDNDIRIEKVACGKHHTIAVEMSSDEPPRVFSWGNGSYGVLGHGIQTDEYFPRLVSGLINPMKIIVPGAIPKSTLSVSAGASCSLLQLPNGHVYYWGKHRSVGEATMRPLLVDALANNGHVVRHVDSGYQTVVVSTANAVTVAWGQGQHGELGFGADAKSSSKPIFVPTLDGCRIASLACGYGHTLFIVRNDDKEDKDAVKKLPELSPEECEPLVEAAEAKTKKRREK